MCGLAALMAVPGIAQAVLPGENGRIVFVSGRGAANNDDSNAKLFLRGVPFSTGGGTTTGPLSNAAGQHRHPTWSPDRTRIAYARGTADSNPATQNFDIYTLDLTNPSATPQPITNTGDSLSADRPAWSPDGTRIAFEHQPADGSTDRDIRVHTLGGGNLDIATGSDIQTKPTWTPDSQTIFYATDDGTTQENNIVREPAGGGTVTPVITGTTDDYQPALSADGTKLCFTRGTFGSNDAEVWTANSNGSSPALFSFDDNVGSYNCAWSPDGTLIAYADGIFTSGDLVIQSTGSNPIPLPLETTAQHFDGNPDWAPDARPQCEDQTVSTPFNTPVQVPLLCADTGPAYERSSLRAIGGDPANGTLSPDVAQDLPASVTYTPNQGFSGTDTFQITTFDEFGFGDREGTVTVNVQPEPPDEVDNEFTFGKVKKNKKRGTAKLTVNVPGPGDLELAKTKKVKPKEKRANEAGKVKLKIKPKRKVKKKLADKGKAKVKAEVTYTPDGGDPNTKTKKVKLKKK